MTDAPGIKTALALTTQTQIREARERGDMIEPAQLPLMPTAGLAPAADQLGGATGGRGEPGRPKGSRNKRTVAWLEYLERRYTSPLVGLAETWSRPATVLAAELGCSRQEAFEIQQAAMIASLPFWHQKLPMAIDLTVTDDASRSEAQIKQRILELAKELGVPLGALIEAKANSGENQ